MITRAFILSIILSFFFIVNSYSDEKSPLRITIYPTIINKNVTGSSTTVIDYKTIKSGPYKDSGSAFRHSTISDSLYFQEVVDNMYEQFTSALKYERGLSDATIQSAANGKVYTGLQAKQINLIDVLGTFEDSINLLLSTTGNIGKTARIVENNEEPFSLFNEFFNKTNQAISFNKMLLFPLPEFKLYY